MYVAELRGKLSAEQENSEDLLTSNVFCFFKYARRSIFLKQLLSRIDVHLTDEELEEAEFLFWPSYDDGTEPDVVILAGDYYLLFEAKYLSGFGRESKAHAAQIPRELLGGRQDAQTLGKSQFRMIAITADYRYPREKIPEAYRDAVTWMNWQAIADLLLTALEGADVPERRFAQDLYDLLVKKRLRGFRAFERLRTIKTPRPAEHLFFPAARASFRGQFLGFQEALEEYEFVPSQKQGQLFYTRRYFTDLARVDLPQRNRLFYRR
jgi:hypothetical protein